jgi:hypothetical protein
MMMVVGGLESSKNIACTILRKNLNSTLQIFSFLPQRKSKTPTDDLFLKVTAIPSRLVLRRGWQERGKGFLRESEENSLTPRNNNTNAAGDQCKEVY